MSPDVKTAIALSAGQCFGILLAFLLIKVLGPKATLTLALGAGIVYFLMK